MHGKNDFDEDIILSGLTITAAPSDNTSYDSSTGKITIESNTASQYAIVKTVSVFVQYTGADGLPLTAQANLEVTNIGYPSEVEFGEIKKSGTPREDGRITIEEISSNKYYVELDTINDQYGHEMTVDDLNKLNSESLLTVIPTPASNSMFFGVSGTPFGEIEGKKVIYLTRGNDLPGTGKLMITSAGGSFDMDITIEDNPFIQTLSVDVPDIYESEESDEFAFSAVDQYEKDINLYDFCPDEDGAGLANGILLFKDKNNLSGGTQTKIEASDKGTWRVIKDTVKKTFKVTYTPNAATQARNVITFNTITAGMVPNTKTVSVGTIGGARQIIYDGLTMTLTGKKNLAEVLKFKDANGKTMDRQNPSTMDSYPRFLGNGAITTDSTIKEKEYNGTYYWTLTDKKLATTGNNAGVKFDADGVVATSNDGGAYVNAANPTATYYVSLLAKSVQVRICSYRGCYKVYCKRYIQDAPLCSSRIRR